MDGQHTDLRTRPAKKNTKCSIRKGLGGFEVGLGGFGQVFGPGRQKSKKEAPPSSGRLFFGMLIQDTAMDVTFGYVWVGLTAPPG